MISPWMVGFVVFTVGPILASLVISLFDTNFMDRWDYAGLRWYRALIDDALVHKALFNTAYYTLAVVPLSTVLALSVAVMLNQGIRAEGVWRTIYYLPSVTSGVAVALLWRWLYHPDIGLVNTLLRQLLGITGPRWTADELWAMPAIIVIACWASGGAMLIFLAGLRGIPTVLYEAAEIDGAGAFRKFFVITIPMLTPTILFNVVVSIIGSWQVFTWAFILTEGGPNNATLTLVLYIYRKGFQQFYFGYAAAVAWLLFAVVLAFVLLALRSATRWVHYERV
ncbi:MAG TPA: sugar ABC transporter permease [Chloroflexota bacterium]|nr:sugar ABC transporter permease [Chloroflexota bacterium]